MQKRRHFLLVASITAGLIAKEINVAFGADPYNCRLKVRTEMGIAPYTGQYYAGLLGESRSLHSECPRWPGPDAADNAGKSGAER